MTKGTVEKYETELKETMKKQEEARYRLHPKKCEIFGKESEWIAHRLDQNGIRPLQDKLEAVTKLKIPKNAEEFKSFSGAIQDVSKYIENLSALTDILRKLLKKKTKGIGLKNTQRRSTT